MFKEKMNLYILSIVGIVAIVGIVVLILNSSTGTISVNNDLSGQAISISAGKTKVLTGAYKETDWCSDEGLTGSTSSGEVTYGDTHAWYKRWIGDTLVEESYMYAYCKDANTLVYSYCYLNTDNTHEVKEASWDCKAVGYTKCKTVSPTEEGVETARCV